MVPGPAASTPARCWCPATQHPLRCDVCVWDHEAILSVLFAYLLVTNVYHWYNEERRWMDVLSKHIGGLHCHQHFLGSFPSERVTAGEVTAVWVPAEHPHFKPQPFLGASHPPRLALVLRSGIFRATAVFKGALLLPGQGTRWKALNTHSSGTDKALWLAFLPYCMVFPLRFRLALWIRSFLFQ